MFQILSNMIADLAQNNEFEEKSFQGNVKRAAKGTKTKNKLKKNYMLQKNKIRG